MMNDYETMKELLKNIVTQLQKKEISLVQAKKFISFIESMESREEAKRDDIAVIGIACHFPEAPDKEQFWENLKDGKESIGDFPKKRMEDFQRVGEVTVLRKGGYLESIDGFDAEYFHIPPRVALQMDPYHRNMLEVLVETLEDAGYSKSSVYGKNIGVYVGNDHTHRLCRSYIPFLSEYDFTTLTGSCSGILASRLSYTLNLQGPALVIDTGCSSGLMALDAAIKGIEHGDCETALVSAINLLLDPTSLGDEIVSDDFVCRPFDEMADGTVWSEGVGGLYIKKLSKAMKDGDNIYGVIKGIATNNDGKSNGITAPNAAAQKRLLIKAWKEAGISPEELSYIETHGTGTALGDPIEITALKSAFAEYTNKKQFCAIGSVKGNIGHAVGAAGLASLIKVLLCLKEHMLPPSVHFERPNHFIPFINSPVYVQDALGKWESADGLLKAGVSGFSIGGTNCHVVLEEAPHRKVQENRNMLHVLPLSAPNRELLIQTAHRHYEYLKKHQEYRMEDICYTMQAGREPGKERIMMLCMDVHSALSGLHRIGIPDQIPIEETKVLLLTKQDVQAENIEDCSKKIIQFMKHYPELEGVTDVKAYVTYAKQFFFGKGSTIFEPYEKMNIQKVSLPVQLFRNIRFWDETEHDGERKEQKTISLAEKAKSILVGNTQECDVDIKKEKVETIVAWIWSDVLGYETIEMTDDFFDLGGDSVAALKIIQILNEVYQCSLPNSLLLQEPEFAEFVACLKEEFKIGMN